MKTLGLILNDLLSISKKDTRIIAKNNVSLVIIPLVCREHAEFSRVLKSRTGKKKRGNKMAELNDPNFDFFR